MKRDFPIPASAISAIIDEWVFSERDRAIIKRSWLDSITYERIGEEFSISPRHVNNIISKYRKRLLEHMK